jgi:hypothetical protein
MLVLRQLLTILLLLCCLGPLGTPLGMVLCFGADGHIAFEPVHERPHSTSSPAVPGPLRTQVAETFAAVEHLGPCTDLAFFASDGDRQLLPTSDTCPKPETPPYVPVLLVVPAFTNLPAPPLLPEHSLPRHHLLTILRSVVLHI